MRGRGWLDDSAPPPCHEAPEGPVSLSLMAPSDTSPRPERKRTDASLQAEREKADEELARTRIRLARNPGRVVALAQERAGSVLQLERARTDDHLQRERVRADERMATRDDSLARVGHDLGTLIAGLAMTTALMKQDAAPDEAGQRMRHHIDTVEHYTAWMRRLVLDLMDVVSVDAGRLTVAPEPHDAAQLVRDALEAFAPLASASKVTLSAQLPEGPLFATFDHGRMLQVLANLLSNAIKFTPVGKSASIRLERTGADVRLAVSDTGVGIEADNLEAIFERFWKAKADDKPGWGLGLYISRCIVEAHGGRIWAESTVGAGSTIFCTLPATPGALAGQDAH